MNAKVLLAAALALPLALTACDDAGDVETEAEIESPAVVTEEPVAPLAEEPVAEEPAAGAAIVTEEPVVVEPEVIEPDTTEPATTVIVPAD